MIVSPVRFVVDERRLVGGGQVSRFPVVVHTAVEELSLSVGEGLGEFLSSKIHIRIEVNVSKTHSGGESETQGDGPDVVITRHIIEQTLETSSDGPLEQHGIGCSGEEQETSVSETLNGDGTLGRVKRLSEAFRNLVHVLSQSRNSSSQHHTLRLDTFTNETQDEGFNSYHSSRKKYLSLRRAQL